MLILQLFGTDSIVLLPLNTPNINSDKDIEECDDGNLLMFDGCSDKCLLEAGFTCSPNQNHPATSNCTGPPVGINGFKPNYMNVFLNFGTPVIVVVLMMCCCVSILKFYPNLWTSFLPFGLHDQVSALMSYLLCLTAIMCFISVYAPTSDRHE